MGTGTKKLSMFMPKRKKTISQSSIGEGESALEASTGGGGSIYTFWSCVRGYGSFSLYFDGILKRG